VCLPSPRSDDDILLSESITSLWSWLDACVWTLEKGRLGGSRQFVS
jgi:hypothetical protein